MSPLTRADELDSAQQKKMRAYDSYFRALRDTKGASADQKDALFKKTVEPAEKEYNKALQGSIGGMMDKYGIKKAGKDHPGPSNAKGKSSFLAKMIGNKGKGTEPGKKGGAAQANDGPARQEEVLDGSKIKKVVDWAEEKKKQKEAEKKGEPQENVVEPGIHGQ